MALTESTAWAALRQLRMGGKKPALPVIVTSKSQLPRRLEGVGCLVVLHQAGESPPVKLLEGLDVIFMFDTCALAGRFSRFAGASGVKLGRCQSWCACAQSLVPLAMDCKSFADGQLWLERQRNGPHAA